MNRLSYLLRKLRRECTFLLGLLFGRRDYVKLVIVTRSRSGSNMLCSYLESHPRVFVWREVFRRPHFFTPELTARLVGGRYLPRFRVVAYKVFYYHRVPEGFWSKLIQDERTYIIHLIRPNFLETFVSHREALATQNWESFSSSRRNSAEKSSITVDIDDMMSFLEENERLISSFSLRTRGRGNLLTLTIDQVASDEGRRKIAVFLEGLLDPSGFGAARNIKQGDSSLEKRVGNYEEVKRTILASKWRRFLDRQ